MNFLDWAIVVEIVLSYVTLLVVASLPVPLVLGTFCGLERPDAKTPDLSRSRARDHWDELGSVFGDDDSHSASDIAGEHGGGWESELRRSLVGGLVISCALTAESVFLALELKEAMSFSPSFALVFRGIAILGFVVVAGLTFLEARQAWIRLQELVYQRDVEDRP